MSRTPVALIGLAGAAFLAGSFASSEFNLPTLAQPHALLKQTFQSTGSILAKGDRLAKPLPADDPMTVSIVELVGISGATVILRDRNGEVLYRSDPRMGATTISKDVALPVITLREGAGSPAVQHPASRQEGNEVPPQGRQEKRRNPVGCMGDVSPLAKASAGRQPSLCLALLDQAAS